MGRLRLSTLLVVVSLVLAAGATAALLVVPFYAGVRASAASAAAVSGPNPPPPAPTVTSTIESRRATLVEVNGPGVLRVLAMPVVLPALALAAAWTRIGGAVAVVGAVLSIAFCLLTGFSIGLFYVPSALALVAASLWRASGEARG